MYLLWVVTDAIKRIEFVELKDGGIKRSFENAKQQLKNQQQIVLNKVHATFGKVTLLSNDVQGTLKESLQKIVGQKKNLSLTDLHSLMDTKLAVDSQIDQIKQMV